jgi:hypothetical protein
MARKRRPKLPPDHEGQVLAEAWRSAAEAHARMAGLMDAEFRDVPWHERVERLQGLSNAQLRALARRHRARAVLSCLDNAARS